jgi:ribosome-associated protein
MSKDTKEFALQIGEILKEKRAIDINIIDVRDQTIITDFFIIATGKNVPNVKALTEEVIDKLSKLDKAPRRKEGVRQGRWVVLDYTDVLIHIFHKDEREYYNLERLWIDEDNLITV